MRCHGKWGAFGDSASRDEWRYGGGILICSDLCPSKKQKKESTVHRLALRKERSIPACLRRSPHQSPTLSVPALTLSQQNHEKLRICSFKWSRPWYFVRSPNVCSTNFPYAMVLNEKRPAKLISVNGLQQIPALCQPYVSTPSSQ